MSKKRRGKNWHKHGAINRKWSKQQLEWLLEQIDNKSGLGENSGNSVDTQQPVTSN
jgi:hypothetical protein